MLTITKHRFAPVFLGSILLGGCGSTTTRANPNPDPRLLPVAGAPVPDISELYRQIGLLAAPGASPERANAIERRMK
jgi:hypothetical protein